MNSNAPFVIKIVTDFIVGAAIRAGTTDPASQSVRAQTALAVLAALAAINAGNVTDGLAQLDAIAARPGTDPALAQTLQNAVAWIGTKAAAIQQGLGGTIAGSAITDLNAQVIAEAQTVAQKYVAPPKPAAQQPGPAPEKTQAETYRS